MIADLARRLRVYATANAPHPYGDLLREAADAIDSLTASADIWEKRCMDSVARLATAEAEMDGWKAQAIEEMGHVEQIAARLAAVELGLNATEQA